MQRERAHECASERDREKGRRREDREGAKEIGIDR